MTRAQERLYRTVALVFCALFGIVGALFLLIPRRLFRLFDAWSASLGLATLPAQEPGYFIVLAVAYMYLVTVLAWWMARDPADPLPPRLLLHAKGASSLLSFGMFFLVAGHLAFLTNGVVDGALWLVILLLARMAATRRTGRAA